MSQVKECGTGTYHDVASALVEQIGREQQEPQTEKQKKTIRRRVYDAMNVLYALGIIAKEKKRVRWVGIPGTATEEEDRLTQEQRQLSENIKRSQEQLEDVRNQIRLYHGLISRNSMLREDEPNVLRFPFIALTTSAERPITISVNETRTEYWLEFPQPFQIRYDAEILGLIDAKNQSQHDCNDCRTGKEDSAQDSQS